MKESKWLYAGALMVCVIVVGIFYGLAPEDAKTAVTENQGFTVMDPEFWGAVGGTSRSLKRRQNQATGKRFTEEEIKRIEFLAARFPNNRLIPRVETPEEQKARLAREKEMQQISLRLTAGSGSREDVLRFYEDRRKLMEDRVELVKYVLEDEPNKWDKKTLKSYADMLKHAKFVMKQLEERKKRSLEALRVRRSVNPSS